MMFSPFVTVHKVAHDARARSKAGVEGVCVFHAGNQDANDFGRREFVSREIIAERELSQGNDVLRAAESAAQNSAE
jgi:hypothetical protein